MQSRDWIMLLSLSLIWGGSFLFVEIALQGLPPFSIVWGRVALAAIVLWALLRATGRDFAPRNLWPALLAMGFLNNVVPFTLFVLAQGQITGALASVLNARHRFSPCLSPMPRPGMNGCPGKRRRAWALGSRALLR